MYKKTKLNEEFFDCTKVKFDIINDPKNVILQFLDSRNNLCRFHFEDMVSFLINYDEDDCDNLKRISGIELLSEDNGIMTFEIEFIFNTNAKIICKKFWYETEYE